MPLDAIELGRRCRRVRTQILDMTLDDASARTGIVAARLEAIEGGRIEPTGDEVLIIADAYCEPVEYFILSERSASIEKASDLYRMYGDTFSSQDRRSIQEFLMLCRMEHQIESLLGSRPRVSDFRPGGLVPHMKTAGQQVAERLRDTFSFEDAPIDDPFHLSRRLGCHVFRRRLLNSRVSGLMLRHEDFGPCILVNYVEGPYRQNFSAAHELCHALLDNDHTVTVTFEEPEDERREDLQKREWRANSFASHLLFPIRARHRLHLGKTTDDRARAVKQAAQEYHVNPVVVLYALQETNRLTQREVARLKPLLTISRTEQDAADMAGETAKIRQGRRALLARGLTPEYVQTCLRAHREGQISYGKLADALLVSAIDVPRVVVALGLDATTLSGETP